MIERPPDSKVSIVFVEADLPPSSSLSDFKSS